MFAATLSLSVNTKNEKNDIGLLFIEMYNFKKDYTYQMIWCIELLCTLSS